MFTRKHLNITSYVQTLLVLVNVKLLYSTALVDAGFHPHKFTSLAEWKSSLVSVIRSKDESTCTVDAILL
jgi:hypothetical protein